MKNLLYMFLGLSLIFGCSDDSANDYINDDSLNNNLVSDYNGLWSGSFSNPENGSWTISVNENGEVIGSLTSREHNTIYSFEGIVNHIGEFQTTLSNGSVVGEFNGQLEEIYSYGSFIDEVENRAGDVIGRKSSETESSIIDYWYYYSELSNGDLTLYDHERYCPDLFMQFNEDGTFLDYWNLSSDGCDEEAYSGTWSVRDGYYELLYIQGGSNDLSQSDIYITYPDDNTMEYDYINASYVYKREL